MAHDALKMKTALEIDESVARRRREEAEREKATMAGLAGVMPWLGLAAAGPAGTDPKPLPPLPTWRSGGLRVDVAEREALCEVLDEAQALPFDTIALVYAVGEDSPFHGICRKLLSRVRMDGSPSCLTRTIS